MNIDILDSTVSDNFFYVVSDDSGAAAVIDPVDPELAIRHINDAGYDLQWVINTHWHPDHVSGNDAVLEAFPDAKITAGPDHQQISVKREFDRVLSDGDTFAVGDVTFDIHETPGHTAGHISLLSESALFCGDTIFVGGAGNCRFGGDPSVLFRTYRDIVTSFDDDVTFYPGHDYARRNIEFALSLQPGHAAAEAMLARVDAHDGGLFATTLGDERAYNPFFRYDDPELQQALRSGHADAWESEAAQSSSDDETTFRTVRELRNHW